MYYIFTSIKVKYQKPTSIARDAQFLTYALECFGNWQIIYPFKITSQCTADSLYIYFPVFAILLNFTWFVVGKAENPNK